MKNILLSIFIVLFSGYVWAAAPCDPASISRAIHDDTYSCFIQSPGQQNETLGNLAMIHYPSLGRLQALNAVLTNCVDPRLIASGLKPLHFLIDQLAGISNTNFDRFVSIATVQQLQGENCR